MCKKKVWSARPTTNERVCLMIKWHACMIYTSRGTKDDESNVWMDVSKTFPASANRYHVDSQTNTTLSCYASAVGIAVASDNRGLRFESSHWQHFTDSMCLLLSVDKIKRSEMSHFEKLLRYRNATNATIFCRSQFRKSSPSVILKEN